VERQGKPKIQGLCPALTSKEKRTLNAHVSVPDMDAVNDADASIATTALVPLSELKKSLSLKEKSNHPVCNR